MKRDMDLIREILFAFEEDRDINSAENTEAKICEHVLLLKDLGFIITETVYPKTGGALQTKDRLTWNGHEFISSIRKDEIWAKIKEGLKDERFDCIKKATIYLGKAWTKKKIKNLLEDENSGDIVI